MAIVFYQGRAIEMNNSDQAQFDMLGFFPTLNTNDFTIISATERVSIWL